MKTKERQSYGHSGLTVELNLMDQYELTHLAERLAWHKSVNEEFENWKNNPVDPMPSEPSFPAEEIDKMLVFLNKLSLTSTSKATVFDIEEEENVEKEA